MLDFVGGADGVSDELRELGARIFPRTLRNVERNLHRCAQHLIAQARRRSPKKPLSPLHCAMQVDRKGARPREHYKIVRIVRHWASIRHPPSGT